MHAMIMEAPGLSLRQVELPLPECGVNDILLRDGSIRGAAVLTME